MPLAPAAVSFFSKTTISPGFLYVSDSFQAVLNPWIPPPIITTLAFVGNDILTSLFFMRRKYIIFYIYKKYK